ncbi:tyrosine-type recombinase/integrase [Anaerosinus massiliensis]|uniref:tyrosine-type recombinase/integrase n=1 Tax=Massilibacillus massiliensis TaxID=1806837 RepID=UPI000DA60A64|nr:site-specific integrase [Massilibacillus massiliensis]
MATIREDGRLQSSVTVTNPITGEKKKKYVYGYTEEELETERDLVKNSVLNIVKITFKSWATDVLSYKLSEKKISLGTYESYDSVLENHIYPTLGSAYVDQITPFMLRKVFKEVKAPRMKQYVYTIVKSIFSQAFRDRMIPFNPCDSIDKPQVETRETKVIDVVEFKDILMHMPSVQFKYIAKTAWECGSRRGELAALRWTDLEFNNNVIAITKSRKKTKKATIEGNTKTSAGKRRLPVTKEYMHEMKVWKMLLRGMLAERNIPWDIHGYVFRASDDMSQPIPLATITNTFAKIVKKMGLPKGTTFHSLRHSHATMLVENDVQTKKIQIRLGHSSAAFTLDRYTHSTEKMQNGIAEIMQKNR